MSVEGFAAIPRWLLYSPDLSPNAKLTYVVIQSHTNERGSAWPSQGTIAEESGLSLSSVKRACSELQALGVVEWETRFRSNGGKGSNIYRVLLSRPVDGPVDEILD